MPSQNRASDAQVKYLRDLATTHAVWGDAFNRDETIACMEEMVGLGLPATAATTLITQATRAQRYPADQVPASDWETSRCRYSATELALYGLSVSVEETIARTEEAINAPFFSSADARALMALARRAQPHPTAQTPLRLSDIENIDSLNVSEGHYAVFDETDTLRFYRIYTPTSGANEGEGVIRRFAGDNLLGLYPDEALLVLRTIDNDPDAAAYRFSDTFTKCWVCGKNLTDSVSRLLSIGPTCRGFANHTGLRVASGEVDHDPARREVFRSLREWALKQGFTDPRNREERVSITMTASRVASAWSGIPGVLGLSPAAAVEVVTAAMSNDISDEIKAGLLTAPKDTLLILIESGVLSADVMQILVEHPNNAVKNAANDFFLAQLGI